MCVWFGLHMAFVFVYGMRVWFGEHAERRLDDAKVGNPSCGNSKPMAFLHLDASSFVSSCVTTWDAVDARRVVESIVVHLVLSVSANTFIYR